MSVAFKVTLPMPSVIRAEGVAAGERHARLHGRLVWTGDDWSAAMAEEDRLVRLSYGYGGVDGLDRFRTAERLELAGALHPDMDVLAFFRTIDEAGHDA